MMISLERFWTSLTLLSSLTYAAHITFTIPASPTLGNPSALPPSTRATLFRLNNTLTAPLTRYNGFDFKHVTTGSYLLTVQCRDYAFEPLRVDVMSTPSGGQLEASEVAQEERVEVHQTFWGNEWDNKGVKRGEGTWRKGKDDRVIVELKPHYRKEYYQDRAGFNPLTFLQNPMILMGLFSLVLIVGIPKLTEGMDEETRKEFQEIQQNNPVTSALTGGSEAQAVRAVQNFDLAGWMAGQSTKKRG